MKNSYEKERKRERELPLSSFNDLFILAIIIKKLLKNSFEEEAERSITKSNWINEEFVWRRKREN